MRTARDPVSETIETQARWATDAAAEDLEQDAIPFRAQALTEQAEDSSEPTYDLLDAAANALEDLSCRLEADAD